MDNKLIEKAQQFAALSLAGKKRYSGELFLDHCLKVVEILRSFDVSDPQTLAAALLHHSLSEGAATIADVEKEFGGEIAGMTQTLEGLRIIKLGKAANINLAENLRKMFLVMAKDLRIVLIKLADILDNLRTVSCLPKPEADDLTLETLEIFAPLAERLGVGEMKGQMQDLAFEYLYPQDYIKVKKLLKNSLLEADKNLLKIKAQLREALSGEGISFRMESRTKHLYSLYLKLKRPEVDFNISVISDLIAFRVITETEEDCYQTLGVIHKLWQPVSIKMRDYIANPKPNGYQSIHTTVFGPNDKPFEIQIRTEKMHEMAEYGLAAHWNYSEAKSKGATDEQLTKGVSFDKKLEWVKQLSKWQEGIVDNEEFLKSVKTDFFGERIFVFTPKGDVKDLPAGATPIDFIYSIHSDLGNRTVSAKVNGRMVALDFKLKNGDVVEVVLSKDTKKKPSRDWLNFVATSLAKRKIKKAYFG